MLSVASCHRSSVLGSSLRKLDISGGEELKLVWKLDGAIFLGDVILEIPYCDLSFTSKGELLLLL